MGYTAPFSCCLAWLHGEDPAWDGDLVQKPLAFAPGDTSPPTAAPWPQCIAQGSQSALLPPAARPGLTTP